MKKYELALETEKIFLGIKMFRIRALISFGSIKAGDLGGYIEKENNLSQDGDAWVSNDAIVSDNARVYSGAWVYGSARVSDNARVYGSARVYGGARVSNDAIVYGSAWVSECNQSVSVTNLRYSFTSLPKGVQVGCKFYSQKEWKDKHLELGESEGMSPELSSAYYKLICAVRRIQKIESIGAKEKK